MANYAIGEILRETRERKKCSQEEVCYGICTPSTLSRIENGVQVPGRRILEALTQRLGMTDNLFTTYMGREEMEFYENVKRLMRSLEQEDYGEVKYLVKKLETDMKKMEKRNCTLHMERQYLLFAKAVLQKQEGEEYPKVLERMLEAVRVTLPDFDGIHLNHRFLTFQEITILNYIGSLYYEMGNVIEAFRIIVTLKEYIEKNISDAEEKAEKYLMVIQNLVIWLKEEKKSKDALILCEEGLKCCIEYDKMKTFPILLYNKAVLLAEAGQLDESRKCFHQVIAVFQAMNQHQQAEKIRKSANRDYKMNL